MPFTPFHFGPHALIGLPFRRFIDLPVFVGVSVAVDVEPLLVMSLNLDYPLHGYLHTLLFSTLVGTAFAFLVYPFRGPIERVMSRLRLDYSASLPKMILSGILGAWLHVLLDATIYWEMRPFYPIPGNPLLGTISPSWLYLVCLFSFLPALGVYFLVSRSGSSQTESTTRS